MAPKEVTISSLGLSDSVFIDQSGQESINLNSFQVFCLLTLYNFLLYCEGSRKELETQSDSKCKHLQNNQYLVSDLLIKCLDYGKKYAQNV